MRTITWFWLICLELFGISFDRFQRKWLAGRIFKCLTGKKYGNQFGVKFRYVQFNIDDFILFFFNIKSHLFCMTREISKHFIVHPGHQIGLWINGHNESYLYIIFFILNSQVPAWKDIEVPAWKQIWVPELVKVI